MSKATVQRSPFGTLADGTPVEAFTLTLPSAMEARVSAFGGALVSLRVPDRDGRMDDVVLGYDTLDGYVGDTSYLGALIGRHANRIANSRFALDGHEYHLTPNDGDNQLHGGPGGFHKRVWDAAPVENDEGAGVELRLTSEDGDQGYPGTVHVRVLYLLAHDGELRVEYEAETDRATVLSLTQHSYWNLSGDPTRDILAHEIQLDAGQITPVGPTLIPTGELAPVDGTPFDFRRAHAIGARIEEDDEQLARAGGYDHNFVVRGGGGSLARAARVTDPASGRTLEVHTTAPGIQFYSGNFLDGAAVGKNGVRYGRRSGFCLEPQQFPDAPNQPAFPPTTLRPGERYTSRIVFRFGIV